MQPSTEIYGNIILIFKHTISLKIFEFKNMNRPNTRRFFYSKLSENKIISFVKKPPNN